MEGSPGPPDVVLKWALHPTIGPKLKGNSWLEKVGLQQPLAGAYSRFKLRVLENAATVLKFLLLCTPWWVHAYACIHVV